MMGAGWRGSAERRAELEGETMKFGIRKPSLKKSFAARTSLARMVRHNMGVKMPRGGGWITDPKKAVYNRVYNRTSISLFGLLRKLFR